VANMYSFWHHAVYWPINFIKIEIRQIHC